MPKSELHENVATDGKNPYQFIHFKCTFTAILPWVWRCRSGGSIFSLMVCWLRKLGTSVVGPLSTSSSAECALMLINEWNKKVWCIIFCGLHQILHWQVMYFGNAKLYYTCLSKSSYSSEVSVHLIWFSWAGFSWTTLPQTLPLSHTLQMKTTQKCSNYAFQPSSTPPSIF